jgi:hypothetical protein
MAMNQQEAITQQEKDRALLLRVCMPFTPVDYGALVAAEQRRRLERHDGSDQRD